MKQEENIFICFVISSPPMSFFQLILQQSRVNDMSNKQRCTECNCLPENVVVQSCEHSLCLWCVKDLIRIANLTMRIIECPICHEETTVDDELYEQILVEIQRQPKSKLKRKNNNYSHQKEPNQLSKQEDYCIQKKCSQHKSYAIMYVCKTCEDMLVCPECLLSGKHLQHTSVSVEKEGTKIKQTLKNELNKISYRIDQLQKVTDNHIKDIEMRKRQIEDIKNAAKKKYQQIRKSISKQQNSLFTKYSQLIFAHENQVEMLKTTVNIKVKNWEALRGRIIDILNPLLQETILGRSRGLQKMVIINAIQSYSKIKQSLQKPEHNQKNIQAVSQTVKASISSLHKDLSLISREKYSKEFNKITSNLSQNQNTIPSKPQIQALNANAIYSKSIENNFFKLL